MWGKCGYAVPNDGGKPTSGNEQMRRVVNFIGLELFSLMHKPDVQFDRPFNLEWLQAMNKMLTLGKKRLGDMSVGFGDKRTGDADHATNTVQDFILYPVPYHGQRIRQADARYWCGEILILISEMMQHSDNDFHNDVTDFSVSKAQEKITRIQNDMYLKYFGATREQVETPGFILPETALTKASYNPGSLFTDSEMSSERMPDEWWPTTNDLTPIKGLPASAVSVFNRAWPVSGPTGDGAAHEAAFPAGASGINEVSNPAS